MDIELLNLSKDNFERTLLALSRAPIVTMCHYMPASLKNSVSKTQEDKKTDLTITEPPNFQGVPVKTSSQAPRCAS